MRYDVLFTDDANHTFEDLPGPQQDVVLEVIGRDLPRLEQEASRGQVDDITYLRAPIAPTINVVFHRIPDEELEELRSEQRVDPDATAAYVVLLLETG